MTATTAPLTRKQRALARLYELTERYGRLVWYARSHPPGDPFWGTVPEEIRRGALNCQAQVEEFFPDEVDRLRCPGCGDWNHGFNSGILAAARLMAAYLHPQKTAAEWDQQVADAESEFPELFT